MLDKNFINKNMMGPDSILILEELIENLPIKKNMRILDLGCGKGLTSIYIAKKFQVEVFAVDLWINASELYSNIKEYEVENLVTPINCDALKLPFANDYFDGIISVDSYHYFGCDNTYFDEKLKPLLKKDAFIYLAFPGMKKEVHNNIPEEMKPYWDMEALKLWQTIGFWENIFKNKVDNLSVKEMVCFDKAWNNWLSCNNEYSEYIVEDKKMITADNGNYMNLIKLSGKVK